MPTDGPITGSYRSRRTPIISGRHPGVAAADHEAVARCEAPGRRPREGERPAGRAQKGETDRFVGKRDAEDRGELVDVLGDQTDNRTAALIINSVGRTPGRARD